MYEHGVTVIGRCMDGVKVVGYVAMDNSTKDKIYFNKEQFQNLVIHKKVLNCTGQVYEDKIVIKGVNCQLARLQRYDLNGNKINNINTEDKTNKLEIIGKITDSKEVIGYRIMYISNGQIKHKDLRRQTVLDLAKDKKIKNARVQMSNNRILLRGVNCDLSKLPSIQLANTVI